MDLKKYHNRKVIITKEEIIITLDEFLDDELLDSLPDEISGKLLYFNQYGNWSEGIVFCQNYITGANPENTGYKYGYWIYGPMFEKMKIKDSRLEKLKRLLNDE